MPQNKDFAVRIEILDACLRNTLHKWTLDKLVAAVNKKLTEEFGKTASRRSIQADIKFLIEERNAPIARKRDGTQTYLYYLDKNFSIKNLPVGDEEIQLLKDAIHILKQVNDFKILDDVAAVVNKLQNTVATNKEGGETIIQFEKNTLAKGTEYIEGIFEAIKSRMPLRITYQPFHAPAPEESLFHPYLLKEYRNRWFVIGRKNSAGAVTNLALDRIHKIKNSADEYVPNNLFDPKTYFNNLIGVSLPEGAAVESMRIMIKQGLVPYIKTKPIHHTQRILEESANGDILIELKLIDNYELRGELLSHGERLQVMEPASLRKAVQEKALQTAEQYQ